MQCIYENGTADPPSCDASPYKNRLLCSWLNPSFVIPRKGIQMACAWCGLLETPSELTQANIFSQEPHTDGHDKHQDPIWVQGISVSTWNPVFEDGCAWSMLAHLAPAAAQSCVCRHMAWHPPQVLVPLNPVLDIYIFLHLWEVNAETKKTTEQERHR